jgi:aminopeptidase N
MKKAFLSFIFSAFTLITFSQSSSQLPDTAWKSIYRGSYPKINDLVHTKLAVNFDFDKQWMNGEEWVTLQPHFYPTDSLTLDAKGMEIKKIALLKGKSEIPLKFSYDSMQLRITLDKIYNRNEKYTIYISYISKPNELKLEGSSAITEAKGLYFINPKGETDVHTEIWTQGETE